MCAHGPGPGLTYYCTCSASLTLYLSMAVIHTKMRIEKGPDAIFSVYTSIILFIESDPNIEQIAHDTGLPKYLDLYSCIARLVRCMLKLIET